MTKSIDKRISESLEKADQIKKGIIEKSQKDKERFLKEAERIKELAKRDKGIFAKKPLDIPD